MTIVPVTSSPTKFPSNPVAGAGHEDGCRRRRSGRPPRCRPRRCWRLRRCSSTSPRSGTRRCSPVMSVPTRLPATSEFETGCVIPRPKAMGSANRLSPETRFRAAGVVPPIRALVWERGLTPPPYGASACGSRRVGADEAALENEIRVRARGRDRLLGAPVDDEAADRDVVGRGEEARRGAGVGPVDLDREDGVEALAGRVRVGRGTRLRVAVDRHRARDLRQRGGGRDRVHARAHDPEGDRVGAGVGVGVGDRLPEDFPPRNRPSRSPCRSWRTRPRKRPETEPPARVGDGSWFLLWGNSSCERKKGQGGSPVPSSGLASRMPTED